MIVVLMGVTGSGKTTVGRVLAERLGWRYFDADDFHPTTNVEKMRNGVPLSDRDRQPWLERLQTVIRTCLDKDEPAVLACSALRQRYRDMLTINDRVRFVFLSGEYKLIQERLRSRSDHYMNPNLLDSQLKTLEEPDNALRIDITRSPQEIVETIAKELGIQ